MRKFTPALTGGLVALLLTALGAAPALAAPATATPHVGECHAMTLKKAGAYADSSKPVPCSKQHTSVTFGVVQATTPLPSLSQNELTALGSDLCTQAEIKLLGRKWRAPTVREAFALADIENPQKAFPKNLYPHFPDFAWIWTSTPYARESNPARPVYAWYVSSVYGVANFGNRNLDGLALPVSPLASSSGQ